MSVKIDTFEKALSLYKRASDNSQKLARQCAQMALRLFLEHGNITQCQQFLDAIPANFQRRAAYVKWLMAFAPVSYEKGQLSVDKSEGSKEANLDGALAVDWWDFAPDKEVIHFAKGDVIVQLERVVKRYTKSDNYKAKDEEAIAIVKKAGDFVAMLKKEAA